MLFPLLFHSTYFFKYIVFMFVKWKNTKNTFPSSANKAERMTIANCSSQVKFIVVVGSCKAKKQEVRSSLF